MKKFVKVETHEQLKLLRSNTKCQNINLKKNLRQCDGMVILIFFRSQFFRLFVCYCELDRVANSQLNEQTNKPRSITK